jgi:hypothetical protein
VSRAVTREGVQASPALTNLARSNACVTLEERSLLAARVSDAALKDLPAFARACPAVSVREVRRRWRQDQVCFVCWIGGEVAAYRWHAAGATYLPYLGRVLRGAPGDIVVIEARTLPGHRRTRAGLLLAQAELQFARQHGAQRVVGLIAAWNRASRAWADAAGSFHLGAVGYRRAGWRRRYFTAGDVRLEGDEVVVLPDEGFSPPRGPVAPGSG